MIDYLNYRAEAGLLDSQQDLFIDELNVVISKRMLDKKIKTLVELAGLDKDLYSTHSLRAGAATSAAEAGFSEWEIKDLGRWASSAYLLYVRQSHSRRWQYAARLAASTR